MGIGCFRNQLLLLRPYLVLTKPLSHDIRRQRCVSVKIGCKYLDNWSLNSLRQYLMTEAPGLELDVTDGVERVLAHYDCGHPYERLGRRRTATANKDGGTMRVTDCNSLSDDCAPAARSHDHFIANRDREYERPWVRRPWVGVMMVLVWLLPAGSHAADCEAVGDVEFICGHAGPEDLVSVPDSRWVLVSEYEQGGLRLIDTRTLTTTVLSPRAQFDRVTYGSCPGPLTPADGENFDTHGLYLVPATDAVHTVYVTHHSTRESVEVFTLDARASLPVLTWVGCVVAPDSLNLNSVVALPDGGFAATSFNTLGASVDPLREGKISGAIWEWHTSTGWQRVPGSETAGPNGLEISPDGRWFYIGAWGTQTVDRLSRGRTPVQRDKVAAGFRLDNLRMAADGSILATGQGSDTERGSAHVARVDPQTMQLEEIIRRRDDDVFSIGTVALEVGDEIWVGSFRGDRIARFKVTR